MEKLREIRPKGLYALLYPVKYLVYAMLIIATGYFAKTYVPEDILKYSVAGLVSLLLLAYILHYLYIKSIVYTVTEEQILFKRGIFTIKTDYIELYRVLDFAVVRSFLLRFIGGMTFTIETTDKSHPVFKFTGIPNTDLDHFLRGLVEENRARKNVFVTE